MTTWRDILDSEIDPDSPITTALMFALRDNIIAFSEGDPSAPTITGSLFNIGGSGYDGACTDATTFLNGGGRLVSGAYDFSSINWTAAVGTKGIPNLTIMRVTGDVNIANGATIWASFTVITSGAYFSTYAGQQLFNPILCASGTGPTGGGSIASGGAAAIGLLDYGFTAKNIWSHKRPILGGGGYKKGGGAIMMLVDGDVNIGGSLIADGETYGGGAGSIIIICTGTMTHLTGNYYSAAGGAQLLPSAGGGGGGYIALVAPSHIGTPNTNVLSGHPAYVPGPGNGLAEIITMPSGTIKLMLWGR